MVDTGANGFLTLPPRLIAEMGFPFISVGRATLADGSEVAFDVHAVAVLWDGRLRRVEAYASDTTPLVGMRLLGRHSLYVEVEAGGRVAIQPME